MPVINPEFQKLIPKLSSEEFKQLEANIIADGCRDPLVLWDDTIIDGHNRFEICNKHGIEFDTASMEFKSESDVKIWMILNQFGKRNISNYQRAELALLLKPIIAEKAKEKQIESGGAVPQKSAKPTIDTRKEIAKQAGVSHDTISKVERIQKDAAPEIIEKVKSGDISINQAYKEVTNKSSYSEISKKIQDTDIKPKSEINKTLPRKHNVNYGDVFIVNGKHKLIIGDSRNVELIKKEAGKIDCVLTDPPYGINYKAPSGNGLSIRGNYDIIDNDDTEFNPDILFEYSDNVITWGGNHYANKLPNSAGWLVWDKRDGEQINNNSDCEMAWCNMLNSARLFHHKWNGMIKDSERDQKRIHPTQKPIKLFIFCLETSRAGKNIIDLYSGSGSTLIACEETNRICTLVEIDPVYGAATIERFINDFGYEVIKK
ncbi:MAG: DNA methyltransferase [Aureibaculum sp.]|nr:DNA methyltransferase [Aureibaculum sp.]